ncbi:MAG: GH3 auxin-responsive promoter family protein [Candidatus Omnitrophota bacterium]
MVSKKWVIPAVSFFSRVLMRRFLSATASPRKTQEQTLRHLLHAHRDSQWGNEHRFSSIQSIHTFRERLPLTTYETFRPYIEKLKQGDPSALIGRGETLLGLGLTSGTTGEPKFVPFTRRFVRDYKRSTMLFAYTMVEDNPKTLEGKILAVFSPAREYRTPGGIWCGSISGWIAENQIPIIRDFYALPNPVLEIKDVHARYYTLMRMAIPQSIGTLITANPSTVLTLARLADDHKQALIRDIHDGTLQVRDRVEPSIFASIAPYLKMDTEKARQLEQLAGKHDILAPRHYWPDLQLVACWKGGTLSNYLDQFPKLLPASTRIRDIGLLATEGRLSIPLASGNDSGCPTIDSVFFEFIPEDEEDQASPRTLLIDELEQDKNYFLVITTASGFTRYMINDLVRVTGFVNRTPFIYFLNKGKHFSSLTGEKLSEYQVVNAVKQVTNELNLFLSYFTLCPCWGEPPYYALLAEKNELGSRALWPKLMVKLDEKLRELNIEYNCKRESGRLGSIRLKILEPGYYASHQKNGKPLRERIEQHKHVYLSSTILDDRHFPILEEMS